MAGRLAKQKAVEAFDTVVDFLGLFEGLEDPRQRATVLPPLDEVLLVLALKRNQGTSCRMHASGMTRDDVGEVFIE